MLGWCPCPVPDTALAVPRAGSVQPGMRLPPRVQPHQRDLQAGLPAPGEQVSRAGEQGEAQLQLLDPLWPQPPRFTTAAHPGRPLSVLLCWGFLGWCWNTGSLCMEASAQSIPFPKGCLPAVGTVPPCHILLMPLVPLSPKWS